MKKVAIFWCCAAVTVLVGFTCGCVDRKDKKTVTAFTEADSLTERYLELHDSILFAWNLMINEDNHKIKYMFNLLHELEVGSPIQHESIKSLEQRIHQLKRIRFTPKSLANSDVVEEYDFASRALIAELIALAQSHTAYAYNTTMQKLVEKIQRAEGQELEHRIAYDNMVKKFNEFIALNNNKLKDIDRSMGLEKKASFYANN